jgi:hypothetical protein
MSSFEKHIFIALSFSTVIMLLNIIAVTTGAADNYYGQISAWLRQLFA